jgi:hypothetical protein
MAEAIVDTVATAPLPWFVAFQQPGVKGMNTGAQFLSAEP